MRNYIFLMLLSITVLSCGGNDKQEAKEFYARMNLLIDRAELPLDVMADSVINVHQQLESDNDYLADTTAIGQLLDKSIMLNQEAIDSLSLMDDPSTDIGLKQTALIYLRDWKDLLHSQFREWQQLLSKPMEDKAKYLSVMFTDPLNESTRLSSNLQQKSILFKKEFGL